VLPGVPASEAVDRTRQALCAMAESYIVDDDGLVPPGAFEAELMGAFTTTSTRLLTMAKTLEVFGEQVRSQRQHERKVPRSYLRAVGAFIGAYFQNESDTHAKLVSTPDSWQHRARRPAIELYCLDPALSCAPVLDAAASIHMSGTMRPLGAYRDMVGLPRDTELLEVASPFPPENRLVVYSPHVTSRYEAMRVDPTMERRLHEEVVSVVRENERNTAVFFPSHRALTSFAAWSAPLFERHRLTFVEEAGMDQEQIMTLLSRFKEPSKSGPGGPPRGKVLLAVMGGRLSEGIDFPETSLEVVIVPGIPYPKPNAQTKSLVEYFERKFGRGWEFAVEVPTSRRLLQAVGRVIRGPDDVGGVAVLDYRAAQFSDRIVGLRRSDDPAREIRVHLESRGAEPNVDKSSAPANPSRAPKW
jgi:DNA excision repair protein ERCC-2